MLIHLHHSVIVIVLYYMQIPMSSALSFNASSSPVSLRDLIWDFYMMGATMVSPPKPVDSTRFAFSMLTKTCILFVFNIQWGKIITIFDALDYLRGNKIPYHTQFTILLLSPFLNFPKPDHHRQLHLSYILFMSTSLFRRESR